MKRTVLILAAVVLLSVHPETDAHDYSEVKAGKWRPTSSPQCEGYNLHLYRDHVEQNRENQSDEYRFSQSGDRMVVTGLKRGRPRITVLGEVSEEYIHFEILESSTRGTVLGVYAVEILEDDEKLEYSAWITAHYADEVWVECSGYWSAGRCSGKEFVIGVPNFPEGYARYSVECTGTFEWGRPLVVGKTRRLVAAARGRFRRALCRPRPEPGRRIVGIGPAPKHVG